MKDFFKVNSPIGAVALGGVALMIVGTSSNPTWTKYIAFGLLGVFVGNFAENKIRELAKKDYLSERTEETPKA